MEAKLEKWKRCLAEGLKLSKKKLEYLVPRGDTVSIKLKEYDKDTHTKFSQTTPFNYLGMEDAKWK